MLICNEKHAFNVYISIKAYNIEYYNNKFKAILPLTENNF